MSLLAAVGFLAMVATSSLSNKCDAMAQSCTDAQRNHHLVMMSSSESECVDTDDHCRNAGLADDCVRARTRNDVPMLGPPPELTSWLQRAWGQLEEGRVDLIIERLMISYGVVTYVELSDTLTEPRGGVSLMLPLMQPEAAVVIRIADDTAMFDDAGGAEKRRADEIFVTYRSTSKDLKVAIEKVNADGFVEPKLYAVYVERFPLTTNIGHLRSIVSQLTARDAILTDLGDDSRAEFSRSSFVSDVADIVSRGQIAFDLKLQVYNVSSRFLLIKPEVLVSAPLTRVDTLPVCNYAVHKQADSMVDVILMSKNRPMQTFAFLESLSQMVTGVGTVWIVLKSESSLTDAGYQLIDRCFGNGSTTFQSPFTSGSTSHPPFRVEFVSDTTNDRWILNDIHTSPEASNRKLHTLGRTLADTVHLRSSASHVMLAVDEMVWIRPVNLSRVVKLLKHCNTGKDEDEIFSMQLRLGRNMGGYSTLPDRENRLFPVSDDGYRLGVDADADSSGKNGMLQSQPSPSTDNSSPMYAFYPRRWPYDFGYVLNVDGVVLRRRDLVNELAGGADGDNGPIDNCRTPGCIENLWIRRSLRRRSRQWHAMYTGPWSTVVNNALVEDARVAGTADGQLSDGSRKLGERLVVDRKRIDVRTFATEHENDLVTAHTRLPVNYIDLPENCK